MLRNDLMWWSVHATPSDHVHNDKELDPIKCSIPLK